MTLPLRMLGTFLFAIAAAFVAFYLALTEGWAKDMSR